MLALRTANRMGDTRCSACGARYSSQLARCRVCKAWGTVKALGLPVSPRWDPKPLARVRADKVARTKTSIPALDEALGGGWVRSCSYLLSAPPGWGKSTFLLQLARSFKAPLYDGTEENEGAYKARTKRLGLDLCELDLVFVRDVEVVWKNITTAYDAFLVDSVDGMRSDDSLGAVGTPAQTASVVRILTEAVHLLPMVGIFVHHVNKDGSQSGARANEHAVDATLEGEIVYVRGPSGTRKKTNRRILKVTKHRHSRDAVVECELTDRGMVNFQILREEDDAADAPRESEEVA